MGSDAWTILNVMSGIATHKANNTVRQPCGQEHETVSASLGQLQTCKNLRKISDTNGKLSLTSRLCASNCFLLIPSGLVGLTSRGIKESGAPVALATYAHSNLMYHCLKARHNTATSVISDTTIQLLLNVAMAVPKRLHSFSFVLVSIFPGYKLGQHMHLMRAGTTEGRLALQDAETNIDGCVMTHPSS